MESTEPRDPQDRLRPQNRGEEVAHFRHQLIGPLLVGTLSHGERSTMLRELSERRVRLPDSDTTRCYSVPTLERWLYAYRRRGMAGLVPRGRSDRGRGRDLAPELRALICDIRREYPAASVKLIVRSLRADGRIGADVKVGTVRRMLAQLGLNRMPAADVPSGKTRLRWQAECPGALWHGDVCHGPTLVIDGRRVPVRVHGMLDDASRYGVALRVSSNEREETMLTVFTQALMAHGKPDALYLDNGSTYRGNMLRLVCSRLGIALLHARPYDASARGKMERFWRRMREEALSHMGQLTTLQELEAKLQQWLTRYYQPAPHAGLMGRSPLSCFSEGTPKRVTEEALRAALIARARRRVRRDSTVNLGGKTWELPFGYLNGQTVTVARSLFDGTDPVVEHDGKVLPLRAVDPIANSRRRRPPRRPNPEGPRDPVDFDPLAGLDADIEPEASHDDLF